jgi:hypothetical protein
MVYALQKFRHYLLGSHFNMYTEPLCTKILSEQAMLEGRICIWFLLFQEYEFEFIIKP